MLMIVLHMLRRDRNIKKFLVDSTAHTIFYGIIGSIVALSLGVKIEIYIAMSILGTIIQFMSGGFFGKFLDFVRDLAKV
jgi:hypothetical protein